MVFTPENIDPAAMTPQQVRSIAHSPELMQAYALNTVAEATAAVRAERPAADLQERVDRIYDKLDDVLWDRLKDPSLVGMVMQQSGEFAQMHERNLQLSAEKEDRKLLDHMSREWDVPRAHLVLIKDGVVFTGIEDGITYSAVGKMPIRFRSDADFNRWADAENVPKQQTARAIAIINATRKLAAMSNSPETAAIEVKNIGGLMPRPEWAEARDAVSSPGQTNGKVFLPKANNEYAGKLVFMTDTHLVQQVGKNSAVTHELAKLENGKDLALAWDDKKVGPRTNIVIKYGEEKGVGEVIPFNVQRATEVKKQGIEWAQQNIANEKTRATFVKHLEGFTQDMAKPPAQQPARSAATPRAPERAPQIDRPR